ncbi:hypothetical protein J1N35_034520 [Gossypium stocksii]|uniref:Uncharacterized protein n=1 Tax=Gossypium stocksii TaxID=47602 RepID=A0A9D3ZQS6_9ROSI|nr:hypothetical protein J1N35_034520 [Gossypium stocksii]
MGLKEQSLSKANPLYSFMNHPVEVKSLITLPVTLEDGKHTTTDLDVRDEQRNKKPEAAEHTKTLQLICDNEERMVKIYQH